MPKGLIIVLIGGVGLSLFSLGIQVDDFIARAVGSLMFGVWMGLITAYAINKK